MSQPILVTGAAGGAQGSTGRRITALLLEKGIPVRAFVHKLDARSDALRELGAEVVQGDLLDRDSVRASLRGIKRAYFTYSVTDGLLEATTIFAMAAREAETELVVNNSQLQGAGLNRGLCRGAPPGLLFQLVDGYFPLTSPTALPGDRVRLARKLPSRPAISRSKASGNY
jgi:NAD(P)-dependent dehydrogenase (short-subunit alcohol dehydrogenase family)